MFFRVSSYMMKCVLLLYFIFIATISLAGTTVKLPKDSIRQDSLLSYCKKHLGTNYQYASCDPSGGFDCSGFVYYVFTHFNVKVPRSSSEFSSFGKTISPELAKPGDVIVFTGTNVKQRSPGHVGIVISNPGEELQFIHSSSNKKHSGVKISSYKESPYYKDRFLKIVRVAVVYK